MTPTILTHSGNYFSFLEPETSTFTIEDIAHALSNICRFGGHPKDFYSVGQHSIFVSRLLPPKYALLGLLHDAAEAFLGDIPTPLKRILPDYKKIESRVEKAIFNKLGLPHEFPQEVKHADLVALATEQRDFMPPIPHEDAWSVLEGIIPHPDKLVAMYPHTVKSLFLNEYEEIKKNRNGYYS